MKLFIYVEGQEEEMFVNRVLRNHLRAFGVNVQSPILAATSFRIGDDALEEVTVGGVTNYASIRDDLLNHYTATLVKDGDILTTLVDLYALPKDFPGSLEAAASGLVAGAKADLIENAWRSNISQANFFPYIQVHEFEALILTRPSVLAEYYPEHEQGIERLGLDCARFRTPEDINGTKETSPSHRIIERVPSYQKIDGFRHLQDIGISELKVHCPRFKCWIERCELFFR